MANIITEKLPVSLTVDDEVLHINSGFRTWIKIEELINNRNISQEDKYVQALLLCYGTIPKNISEALKQMFWFYTCDEEAKRSRKKKEEAIYSFNADSKYIYAAFMEQYSIDLTETTLHWWAFKALFASLNQETFFCKIMSYRSMNLSEIKETKLKKHYADLKEFYSLPDLRTEEEKEAEWGSLF